MDDAITPWKRRSPNVKAAVLAEQSERDVEVRTKDRTFPEHGTCARPLAVDAQVKTHTLPAPSILPLPK